MTVTKIWSNIGPPLRVLVSVPWGSVPTVLDEAGELAGRVVIDTTNHFGPGGVLSIPDGLTAADLGGLADAAAMEAPGARAPYTVRSTARPTRPPPSPRYAPDARCHRRRATRTSAGQLT